MKLIKGKFSALVQVGRGCVYGPGLAYIDGSGEGDGEGHGNWEYAGAVVETN